MADTICVIPARGGSKRIPRKNLILLAGKPLLAYTIEAALESGVFASVVVSSEDKDILEAARAFKAQTDERPDSLAGDSVRAVEVVEEYLSRTDAQNNFDHVAMMLPTCPFRLPHDMREAHRIYIEQGADKFLVTVNEYDFPPQLAMRFRDDSPDLTMINPEQYVETTRSQSIAKAYHPNGALYLAPIKAYLRTKTFFTQPILGYIMPPERSFDIDYPFQIPIAQVIMAEKLASENQP